MNIAIVAIGGALGAVCRFGISTFHFEQAFPVATFITNLIGAFLIGFVVGIAEKGDCSDRLILFMQTGFCGGFTTFSTFSLESMNLLSTGKYLIGGSYIVASLVCCIIGVALGRTFACRIGC